MEYNNQKMKHHVKQNAGNLDNLLTIGRFVLESNEFELLAVFSQGLVRSEDTPAESQDCQFKCMLFPSGEINNEHGKSR